MRRMMVMAVLAGLAVLDGPRSSAARQDAEAEAHVIGFFSVNLQSVWEADAFATARTAFKGKAQRLQGRIERHFGVTAESIQRASIIKFKVKTDENELLVTATVLTTRTVVDPAELVTRTDGKLTLEKGKLDGHADAVIYHLEHRWLAQMGNQVITWDAVHDAEDLPNLADCGLMVPMVKVEKPKVVPKYASELITKALARDADRATFLLKEKLLAAGSFDVAEMNRFTATTLDASGETPTTFQPLMRARFLSFKVALMPALEVRSELTFPDLESAAAGRGAADTALRQVCRALDESFLHPKGIAKISLAADIVRTLVGHLEKGEVTLAQKVLGFTMRAEWSADLALRLTQGVQLADQLAARDESQRRMMKLAMAAYQSVENETGGLLQNICNDKGKPLLSWRVRLLPHLDQQKLYEQFKLDEPWDSAHNKPLVAKMPKVYGMVTTVPCEAGHTFYQAFSGKNGQTARPLLQDGDEKGLSTQGLSDGTSNTIMLAEAVDAVPWTKPADIAFDADEKAAAPKLGGHIDGGFNVIMCDSTTRWIEATIQDAMLKALITANGGETVSLDDE